MIWGREDEASGGISDGGRSWAEESIAIVAGEVR